MPDFPTFNDLFRVERDEVLSKNAALSLDVVDRDGTDANVMLAAGAAAGDQVVAQLIDVAAGQFLDSATGQALDRVVFDRYGLVRKQAAPALGSAEFSTTAANPSTFSIPIGTQVQTSDGIRFVTTQVGVFLAGGTGPVIVPIRSTLAGIKQQAKVGTITSIITSPPGSPADLKVTNSLATAGADDQESDGSLRDRARRFFLTARRGTLRALEDGATSIPGVRRASAIEVIDVLGRPARLVQLIIADAFTDALVSQNVSPASYQTQSQALAATVFAGLSDVRAAGMFVQVFVAQVVLQPIVLRLRFQAGVDADFVALVARAAITAKVNDLRPGQTMLRDDLLDTLKKVSGLLFVGDEIASPAGDVVPRALQVIRTSLNLVTAQAIQTDQSSAVLTATTNPDAFIIQSFALPE